MQHDLFVGVTTWNSEQFIAHCLRSIVKTTSGLRIRIGVVDNLSRDRSAEIARGFGADVRRENCSQAIALNRLLSMSTGRYTLLVHSDVVLLAPNWFAACTARLAGDERTRLARRHWLRADYPGVRQGKAGELLHAFRHREGAAGANPELDQAAGIAMAADEPRSGPLLRDTRSA